MTTFIGEALMVSENRSVRAIRTPDGWAVSWIPHRFFGRNGAVTAMVLADAIASGVAPGSKHWWAVQNWLAELGLAETDLTPLCQAIAAGGAS